MREPAAPYTLGGMLQRLAPTAIAALALLVPLAACSSSSDADATATSTSEPASADAAGAATPAAQALADGRTPIDVRTPEEYDAGHVDGATLIDIQAADFDQKVAELDPEGAYVVYCRSGNRSAQAAARMQAAGLDVVDGGALTAMAAAGWATS